MWNEIRNKITDIYSLISLADEYYGESKFILSADNEIEDISFYELKQLVVQFDKYFNNLNIAKRESIAVMFENSPLMSVLFLCIIASGRVFVPLNPRAGDKEIDYILNDSKPSFVIFDKSVEAKITNLEFNSTYKKIESQSDYLHQFKEIDITNTELEIDNYVDSDSVAQIVFTSGTTGNPKGVVLTHRNILEDAYGIGTEFNFPNKMRFLTACPLFHNSGQIPTTMVPLFCGGSTIPIASDIGLAKFWYFVDKYEAEWSFITPTFFAFFMSSSVNPQKKSMKGIFSGGAKISEHLLTEFEERFSIPIYEAYGLTETTSFATCVKNDLSLRKTGSAGSPLSVNEIKIMKNREFLSPYEEGEIVIKGSNLFKEYLNLPEVTSDKKRDGWFHSGDLGYLDENDNVFVVDRIDTMILVGGENVYPSEIEKVVPLLPKINNAVLSSIPDKLMGNKLVLLYDADKTISESDLSEFRVILSEHISSFKIPSLFINIQELGFTEIPQSPNGKILRKKIKDLLINNLLR